MRKNGGITLIALVITIIVLIILAGVSINLVLGDNGIIGKAREAQKAQNVAKIQEKLELEKIELSIENEFSAKLDQYLQHLKNKGVIDDSNIMDPWNVGLGNCYITIEEKYTFLLEQEGENIKITYADAPVILKLDTTVNPEQGTIGVKVVTTNIVSPEYEYSISEDKTNYTVMKTSKSDEYTFEDLTADKQYYIRVKITDENGEDDIIKPVYTSAIQPGAFVSYTPTAQTFTMTTEQTGYETTQSFNTADYTGLWRVLYNDVDHGLQLISADVVDEIYLSGAVGYNKVIESLNTFSGYYKNTALPSVARIVGTNPVNPVDPEGNITFRVPFNGSTDSGLKVEDTEYLADYQAMSQLDIHDVGSYYWLGSRKAYHDSEAAYFSIYTLANGGTIEYRRMIDMYANVPTQKVYEFTYAYGVRPVIGFAKDSIGIASGTGSEQSPFVFVAK